MPPLRHILHVDMDAFFASVEQLDNPALRGKPVLVGGSGPRGVVAAASYEARKYGCHSAQPTAVAKRLCPQALIVPGRYHRYRELSERVFAILEKATPIIQPVSIDEAFLDVTGVTQLKGPAESIARSLKSEIKSDTGLTASIGVAPNKFLAKLASDMNKPDGLCIIREEDIETILPPLPVGRIYGIGPKTAQSLANVGIKTIADLRRMPPDWLQSRFGSSAQHYLDLAHGRDDRPVHTDREAKSIGHENTFGVNLGSPEELRNILVEHVETVSARLRRHSLFARRVSLKIRFGDFQTISRSRTLPFPTDRTDLLLAAARELFDAWATESFSPVRLLGMSAEDLGPAETQLQLFGQEENAKARTIDQALDSLNQKFGSRTIHRAGN